MRWVVSLLVCMLVIPIAIALDVSFLDSTFHYTSDPVDITFTTDTASTCYYSLTHYDTQSDFSCLPTTCTYASCVHTCPEKTVEVLLEDNVNLGTVQANHTFNVSFELPLGFAQIEVTCENDFESSSRSRSFLYDPDAIRVDWTLLSRERFTTNQESIFYAYLYGRERIDEVQVTLVLPDKTTKTQTLDGFTPGNGYVFSYLIQDISVRGFYLLNLTFVSENLNVTIEKEFEVVSPGSFSVNLENPTTQGEFDLIFYDAVSGASSYARSNISTDKLLVPDAFADVEVLIDEYVSVYLQNVDVAEYELVGQVYVEEYELETETVGNNKPQEAVANYIIHLNNSLEYISRVTFNYSKLGITDPTTLKIFKADATNPNDVDLISGEFYMVGSTQKPLYIDEEKELAWIFVDEFSLVTLIQERNIGRVIDREPQESTINLTQANLSLEGIHRDMWTFPFGARDYSFLINTIDGAIVYFEFSPNGNILPATVGRTIRSDLDGDQTDDVAIYINAIAANKVIFSASLLTQPQDRSSLEEILGENANTPWGIYVSTPLFWVYLGLALLILFFGIIWIFTHGHKKPSATLTKREKEELDSLDEEKLPLLDSVRALAKQGMDARSIENRLIAVGWPRDVISKVLEGEGLKKVLPELTSEEKVLLEYVQKQRVFGATKELIAKRLQEVGWKDTVIKKIMECVD